MTPVEPPRRVTLWGAEARLLAVASRWQDAGIAVTLVEPDAHDADRSRAMLARAGLAFPVRTPADPVVPCDMLLLSAPEDPGVLLDAMPGGVIVRLGAGKGPLALDLLATTGAPVLAELVARPEVAGVAQLEALMRAAALPCLRTGGVGSALRAAAMAAADGCLRDGATPAEVDAALEAFGFSIGPYALEDLIGLGPGHAARVARGGFFRGLAEHAAAEGRLGKAAGVGWYRYPGGGGAVEDPLVEDLIRVEAHLAGVVPRDMDAEEIAGRVTAALVDDGALAVVEGRGDAPAVDRIAVAGLGFPAALGGPLAWCDRVGAAAMLPWLEAPSDALRALAARRGLFRSSPPSAAARG